MKILVTGGNGQLGTALKEVLKNEVTFFTDTAEMDITNKETIKKVFDQFQPTALIHGAAYTNVDGCEENPELAERVNQEGTENLAEACRQHQCQMVYISTDYVFDGQKRDPYTEDDQTNPQSVYGKTKLAGETATLSLPESYILRTSWVYGEGKNFVKTMLSLSEKMTEIKVVKDQIGRPTAAIDLAKAIYDVIKKQPTPGIYNVTGNGGPISWADFAREIFRLAGKETQVTGITTEEYFSQYSDRKIAPRPAYSVLALGKAQTADIHLADWKESLALYLK